MAGTADLIRSGLEQAAAGKQLDSETIDGSDSSPSSGVQVIGDDDVYRAENSTQDDFFNTSEDAPADSEEESDAEASPSEAKSEEDPKTSESKEVITITDDKGKRKVEVDFSNRDKLKKYVQMAHGARKWQAERDQARGQVEEIQSELGELKSNWEVMNKVYGERGVEGLVDLLEGKQGAYRERLKQEMEKARFLENASPDELESYQQREASERQSKELERMRKENEDFRKQMTQKEEQAELASLESRVHPAFDRYRFADKLGNADDEQMFDEMLWNSTLKRLEPYEEKGIAISPELVEKEFKTVATAIRRRIGLQAEKKASKVIAQKKTEATENVQQKVRSGYKRGGVAEEARNLINDGNLTGLLKNWGKYGSVFKK